MEGEMKIGSQLVAAALTLVVLSIAAFPTIVWSADTNAHAYTDANCTTHFPTTFTGSSKTFVFCKAASGATSWSAEIRNSSNALITTCSPNPLSWTSLPPNTQAITCSGLPLGTIKTKVFWYVGGSPMMEHPHNTFRSQ